LDKKIVRLLFEPRVPLCHCTLPMSLVIASLNVFIYRLEQKCCFEAPKPNKDYFKVRNQRCVSIHSHSILSDDRSKASSKTIQAHSAI